jgi:hypothetical protein
MNLARDRKVTFAFFMGASLPTLVVFVILVAWPIGRGLPVAPQTLSSDAAQRSSEGRPLGAETIALEVQKSFLQSRLQLSQTDAVSLSVDLVDSTACLEIKGVVVRSCQVPMFTISALGQHLRRTGQVRQWLSTPFTLQQERATLPKAPIRIREAPKDTVEAALIEDEIPMEENDLTVTLSFDRNLSLAIKTSPTGGWAGWRRQIARGIGESWQRARVEIDGLMHLTSPAPEIHISLELTREDAKAIYRALPPDGRLALRM